MDKNLKNELHYRYLEEARDIYLNARGNAVNTLDLDLIHDRIENLWQSALVDGMNQWDFIRVIEDAIPEHAEQILARRGVNLKVAS